jgi:hypothetical protein
VHTRIAQPGDVAVAAAVIDDRPLQRQPSEVFDLRYAAEGDGWAARIALE